MIVSPQTLIALQAKAVIAEAMAEELRMYRGFVGQFDVAYQNSRLFAPLAAYEALFGNDAP